MDLQDAGFSDRLILHTWCMEEVFHYWEVAKRKDYQKRIERLWDLRVGMNGTAEYFIQYEKDLRELKKFVGKTNVKKKKKSKKAKSVASSSLKLRIQSLGKREK